MDYVKGRGYIRDDLDDSGLDDAIEAPVFGGSVAPLVDLSDPLMAIEYQGFGGHPRCMDCGNAMYPRVLQSQFCPICYIKRLPVAIAVGRPAHEIEAAKRMFLVIQRGLNGQRREAQREDLQWSMTAEYKSRKISA